MILAQEEGGRELDFPLESTEKNSALDLFSNIFNKITAKIVQVLNSL